MTIPKPLVLIADEPTGSAARWHRRLFLTAALILACTLAAIPFFALQVSVAQTPPGGGGYGGGGGYEGGGYGEAYGGGYASDPYGGEMIHGAGESMMPKSGARQELEAQVAPLVSRLRKARGDEQQNAIRRELSDVLEDYFDRDLERRLEQITAIEQRVQRIRGQCDQRKQAKEEILQLQLKVLENQAAGLGFFGQEATNQEMRMGGGMGSAMGGMDGMGDYPGAAQPATGGSSVLDLQQAEGGAEGTPTDLTSAAERRALTLTSGAEEVAILEADVRASETRLKLVEAAYKQDEVSALSLQEAQSTFEIATQKLARAKREYGAKERLLELEMRRAQLELDAAKAALDEHVKINERSPATIPAATIRQAELAVQTAELSVERAQIFLDLHRESAEDESP